LVKRKSSVIVSTRIVSSISPGRDRRGLLEAALAPEEAGAPLAPETKWTSALALAAMKPIAGAIRPEEGRIRAEGCRKSEVTINNRVRGSMPV
jgi:hypothetical protein